ncbi:ATP-binding protein [Pseudonocardia nigra]|uniref:ATP-binding protein n=1 Tax=Pseudonocardia nigra TaxID=1921578 RepID=UPI001C5F48C5|nr:ATP-binding protein [Pseudonocardia nigra]
MLVELRGLLSRTTRAAVRDRLAALLHVHACVLLDVNDLQIQRASTLRVVTAAMDQAGGWPDARLVLLTTDPLMREALQTSGVTRHLWVAQSKDLARARCPMRPPHVRARWTVPPAIDAPARLRPRVRQRCLRWGLAEDAVQDAVLVVNELVSNAVDHARTSLRLQVHYDGRLLRIKVTDHSLDPPRLMPHDMYATRGRGLQLVDALAQRWGWTTHNRGKTVWATLS